MSGPEQDEEHAVRERAYFIWEHDGRPDGRAYEHWMSACAEEREHLNEQMYDEEKIMADRADANLPALLTRDVPGG